MRWSYIGVVVILLAESWEKADYGAAGAGVEVEQALEFGATKAAGQAREADGRERGRVSAERADERDEGFLGRVPCAFAGDFDLYQGVNGALAGRVDGGDGER